VSRALGRWTLRILGWGVEGVFPNIPKLVVIAAPHTSNWDFIVGILAVFALGLRARFIAKHQLFKPPLGWLMRWFGGIPVNREAPQGMVPQAVAAIEQAQSVFLAITPSGTRSSTRPWKSGFYRIAVAARVPIMPIAFDGEHKTIRLHPAFEPSGDYDADLPKLRAYFDGVRGIRP